MYKVLLADDEQLDLDGLRRFTPWEELGMEVAAAVNSGFAALDVMSRQTIDILVTDIRMPNMSGLELARQAAELRPGLKIVLVSGYADFQYAKQAIEMSACSYVLKPVDDDEMAQALRTAAQTLDRERLGDSLEQTFRQSAPYMKDELLGRLLEGRADGEAARSLLEQYGLDRIPFPAAVVLFEIDDLDVRLRAYPEEERPAAMRRWLDELLGITRSLGLDYGCRADGRRIALLLPEPDQVSAPERIIADMKTRAGLSVTAGLGEPAAGLADVHRSYIQAEELLGCKMFYGKGRLISPSVRDPGVARDSAELGALLNDMFSAISRYELVRLVDAIRDLFLLAAGVGTKHAVYHFVLHAIAKLDDYLREFNENFYDLTGTEFRSMELLFSFETTEDMQSWLRRKAFAISERLHLKRVKKNRRLIEEIKQYVETRLDQTVTVRDAANRFSFAPNYLGHLFKEETGVNFSDYVTARRLEKARRLLQNPNLKVYEVAGLVGYRSLPYFSRHFKEVFGMTPGEYRRRC